MLKPYNVKKILNNAEKIFKNNDIELLNEETYIFISLMTGFIAHYNLYGFQGHYSDLRDLLGNIEGALSIEQDTAKRDVDDTKHNGYGLPYCKSKLEIVKGLKLIVEKYKDKIFEKGSEGDSDRFEILKECIKRAETDLDFRKEFMEKLYS